MDRQASNKFIKYISIITLESLSVSSKIDVKIQREQALIVLLTEKNNWLFTYLLVVGSAY